MVVDTSAAVAILLDEPAGPHLRARLVGATFAVMSAASRVELGMVLEGRLGGIANAKIARFLRDMGVEIVPFEQSDAERALDGWRQFGKGNHPAGLNFGDCFTYALASTRNLPVLCTGKDFAQTDVSVIPPGDAR